MSLNWNPSTYEEVTAVLDLHPGVAPEDYRRAVAIFGALPCPAPATDPSGEYRVIESWGQLTIQRLDPSTGTWRAQPRANRQE
jgi:hypothetical protein